MRPYINSLTALHDFIATVVLGAPDRFRYRDHRPAEDQLNLDRAFNELRAGLEFVHANADDPALHDRLQSVLDEALAAYRAGDRKRGAHLLQDFQDMIFGPSRSRT